MSDFPNEQEILDQLQRIVSSPDFTAGPRTQNFLRHLVQEELAGRGEDLRGTVLAMDVFGRGGDFDPGSDPVVRIEAVKLRKALEHFYLTSGARDEISISVPKGQYRPQFETRTQTEASRASVQGLGLPTLGVAPFAGSDSPTAKLYRDGLPEEIALELARFDQIKVITGWSADTYPEVATGNSTLLFNCDYVLRGTVRDSAGHIRVTVQLTRISNGALAWSERFDIAPDKSNVFEIQEQIARQCAVRLADAYGAVAEDLGGQYSGRIASDVSVYEALLAFQAHMRTNRKASLHEFVELSEAAVRDNPGSGLAHALAALGCIEQVVMGQKRIGDIQDTGHQHAERAISLAPHCQEALFAAAIFAQIKGDTTRFERLITAAISANPNGNLLTALAGGWIAMIGDIDRGADLVRQALSANPVLPIWTNTTLCLQDISRGDFAAASEKVRHVDARDCAGEWVTITAAHALAGETELARAALSNITDPAFDANVYLCELPFPSALIDKLREGLSAL